MPAHGPDAARCEVLVFREGLLSAVGHDLLLRVERFELRAEPGASVEGSFDPASLRVVGALRDGRPLPGALSAGDVRKIEEAIAREVLDVRRFPEIRFASTAVTARGAEADVAGRLELHGTSRPLLAVVRRAGERRVAEVRLRQPDFGIRPYTALFGAIKVKPEVVVRVSVPAGEPA